MEVSGGVPGFSGVTAPSLAVGRRYRLVLYAMVGAATILPVFLAQVPPLVDYPNHLARMWILVHQTRIPELAGNYSVDWRLLPDLAMDLVVAGLSRAMPVEEAGRVFVALTMLALVGGTLTLHRVLHGRLETWPLCSALFVYNAALFWGFVNCLFATGICFFAFSGWIATRHWRIDLRVLAFSAVASLLLVLHLFAFGLYALSVTAYELGRHRDGSWLSRRSLLSLVLTGLQLLPGIVLWHASLAHGGPTLTLYGGLAPKIYAVLAPFTFGAAPAPFDGLVVAATCLLLIIAVTTRSLEVAPDMRLPLAAMAVAAVLMPNRMSGSWSADIRLPVALPFLIVASTRLTIARKGVTGALATAALVMFGLRIWSVSQSWRDYDTWFDEFRSASAVIAPGARLLVVESPVSDKKRRLPAVPEFFAELQPVTFIHMAALAVIDRAAFFPYMFTGWSTIDVTPRNEAVAEREGVPATPDQLVGSAGPEQAKYVIAGRNALGELPYWRNWPKTFDYVLWMDFGAGRKPELKQLRPLTSGSFFGIYRVVRP